MARRDLLALLLGLVIVTVLCACEPPGDPPGANVMYSDVVYSEGTVSGGRFHQLNDGVGSPGEEIAVVIHTPVEEMSVTNSTVKVSYVFNERTDDAMGTPNVEYALTAPVPSALDDSDSTESFWFPIPGSAELQNCDWIHYRWSFQYTRPDSPDDEVGFIGETRLIRILGPTVIMVDGDMYTKIEEECEAVP